MKNKAGSIIASIILLFVVGSLLYMFYLQSGRIKKLQVSVDTLETTIDTLEEEKMSMEETIKAMEADCNQKNDEIDKLSSRIEILNDNVNDITRIRRILEDNYEYYEDTVSEDKKTISFMDMTDDELRIYDSFKEEYNDETLRAVEPFTIMKFYLHSVYLKDYETEYELYVEHEDSDMSWTKEEHFNIPERDRMKDYGVFQEAYNVEVEIEGNYAVIKWNSDYDNEENFKYGFSLVKNEDAIWKVSFLPMQ
jgi:outer membrane murein-binding lipoprotein Lpp